MSEYSPCVPASSGRRFGAFLANLFLLGIPSIVFKFLEVDKEGHISSALAVVLILLCCAFPESPGKRILNLKIVDEKMAPASARLRIWRATPFLLFFAVPVGGALSDSRAGATIVGGILMLTLFFIFANAVAVYFSPQHHSLLDMKLGTRVLTPRRLPGQESPRILGFKAW